ncbi:MAG TPA: hypothetical protein VGE30_03910 [Candidatus Saccharimonadales bacterium]
MNIVTRAFFALVLIGTTLAWYTVPPLYPGLLSQRNFLSLLAAVVLGWLFTYGFKTKDRQTFWKAMMVILTLCTLVTLVLLVSGLTVVLAGLVACSLLSLGVLYDEQTLGNLAVWWQRFSANRQLRQERKTRGRVHNWEQLDNEPTPASSSTLSIFDEPEPVA